MGFGQSEQSEQSEQFEHSEYPIIAILDFESQLLQKPISSNPSRSGVKNPLRAIRVPRAIRVDPQILRTNKKTGLCFARFVFLTLRGPLASHNSNRSRIARYIATKLDMFAAKLLFTDVQSRSTFSNLGKLRPSVKFATRSRRLDLVALSR